MNFLTLFLLSSTTAQHCPVVNTQTNFNLTEYIRERWYIQQQQITSYLPLEENYCVTAKYNISDRKILGYKGVVLNVYNYANLHRVNGRQANKHNQVLCARVPDQTVPSKLLVAPCFLPNVFAGDYWVIAAGPKSDNYEWAIVSGGQPTVQYKDGCTTKTSGSNGAGFWYFSRVPVASDNVIKKLNRIAKSKGYTLSQLHNVTQVNCSYV